VPENSLEAFRAALALDVRWLEIDVRRTADDDLFVLHYPTLDDGRFLVDVSTEEVAKAGVLALADLLPEIPPGVGIIFDVKTALEDALRPLAETTVGLLTDVIRQEGSRRPVLVTSFDPAVLMYVGDVAPGVPRGLISWISFPLRKAIPAAAHLGVEVVSAHWKSFARNGTDSAPFFREAAYYIDVAHRAGLEVLAWAPTLEPAAELVAAGVDALIVDDLPAALERFRP
jgi:glycerophosphoryl diester phosphodiesterase